MLLRPPLRNRHTGRLIARRELPGSTLSRSRAYRSRLGLGLGQYDESTLLEKQAELQQLRAERQQVEAELAALKRGGLPVASAPALPSGSTPQNGAPAPAPAPPPPPRVPTLWIVAAGIAGLFVLRGLRR